MLKLKFGRKSRRRNRRLQKGQVLVIVAFAITILVLFVGLVIDTGLVFIQYGRLRRAVDAAALSASLQYRDGYTIDSLRKAAIEFLVLNGIQGADAEVYTCETELLLCDGNNNGDPNDSGEQRKFVHVIAKSSANLAFLPVIGIKKIDLAAEAISEAASLDVVLVIDRSESMTWDADPGDLMRDPQMCNAAAGTGGIPGECEPFRDVKKAAYDFVDKYLFFPYDRVAVITFDSNVHIDMPLTHCADNDIDETTTPKCSTQVLNTIRDLTVFDPNPGVPGSPAADGSDSYLGGCYSYPSNPCRWYLDADPINFPGLQDGAYTGLFGCPELGTNGPSRCVTTNTGGALMEAANEFGYGYRAESLWVVILLSDGQVNSSTGPDGGNDYCTSQSPPYCMDDGYLDSNGDGVPEADPDIRHCLAVDNTNCLLEGGIIDVANYNVDDFARDMADFVALPTPFGQDALIFSIGLGDLITTFPAGDPENGEEFLKYAAEDVGGGLYYFAPTGNQLQDIFADIADKIAVRLTH